MELIDVRIRNFEKYKGRADVTHNSWFRMDNRILEDHEFFDFTAEEFKVWVYLLCLSSQKNQALVHVSYQHAHHVCGLNKKVILSAIEKLKRIGCIDIPRTRTSRGRYAEVTQTCATDITNITEQTINNILDRPDVDRSFDLDSVYQKYPRKQGKAVGLRKLRAQVRGQADFVELHTALDNFLAHHRSAGTEPQFIPHFKTWVSSWRDWLDPDAGKSAGFAKKAPSLADLDLDNPGGAA